MESSTILPLSHLSFIQPNPCRRSRTAPFRPWKQRISQPTRFYCQKMVWRSITRSQGSQKPPQLLHLHCKQSYNPEAYEELMEFLGRHSLNDGDKFCADLMRESSRHRSLALRILEVRSAYCKNDFEWDNLQRLASKMVGESNTRLMKDYVSETTHEK